MSTALLANKPRHVDLILESIEQVGGREDVEKYVNMFAKVYTPLMIAASKPNYRTVLRLLEAGADPNVDVTFAGNSSLHVVAGMSDQKLGDAAGLLLVEFGANLHQVNKAGKTALDVWIQLNEKEDEWNEEAGGWSARPEWSLPVQTLQCLAARVIRVHKIDYTNGKTPTVLHSLIELRSDAD